MKRLMMVVEGQTEERFVGQILAVHLAQLWVVQPFVTRTSATARGGALSWQRNKREINNLLSQNSAPWVTTLFDLYALPSDFPGVVNSLQLNDPYQKALCVEQAMQQQLNHPQFIAHVQLYEFESLLFANPATIEERLSIPQNQCQVLAQGYATPEHINQNTPPSKRILSLYPSYSKPLDGLAIAQAVGLSTMRQECQHFDQWLRKLEDLGAS